MAVRGEAERRKEEGGGSELTVEWHPSIAVPKEGGINNLNGLEIVFVLLLIVCPFVFYVLKTYTLSDTI